MRRARKEAPPGGLAPNILTSLVNEGTETVETRLRLAETLARRNAGVQGPGVDAKRPVCYECGARLPPTSLEAVVVHVVDPPRGVDGPQRFCLECVPIYSARVKQLSRPKWVNKNPLRHPPGLPSFTSPDGKHSANFVSMAERLDSRNSGMLYFSTGVSIDNVPALADVWWSPDSKYAAFVHNCFLPGVEPVVGLLSVDINEVAYMTADECAEWLTGTARITSAASASGPRTTTGFELLMDRIRVGSHQRYDRTEVVLSTPRNPRPAVAKAARGGGSAPTSSAVALRGAGGSPERGRVGGTQVAVAPRGVGEPNSGVRISRLDADSGSTLLYTEWWDSATNNYTYQMILPVPFAFYPYFKKVSALWTQTHLAPRLPPVGAYISSCPNSRYFAYGYSRETGLMGPDCSIVFFSNGVATDRCPAFTDVWWTPDNKYAALVRNCFWVDESPSVLLHRLGECTVSSRYEDGTHPVASNPALLAEIAALEEEAAAAAARQPRKFLFTLDGSDIPTNLPPEETKPSEPLTLFARSPLRRAASASARMHAVSADAAAKAQAPLDVAAHLPAEAARRYRELKAARPRHLCYSGVRITDLDHIAGSEQLQLHVEWWDPSRDAYCRPQVLRIPQDFEAGFMRTPLKWAPLLFALTGD